MTEDELREISEAIELALSESKLAYGFGRAPIATTR